MPVHGLILGENPDCAEAGVDVEEDELVVVGFFFFLFL
jgi:hypothetical protein